MMHPQRCALLWTCESCSARAAIVPGCLGPHHSHTPTLAVSDFQQSILYVHKIRLTITLQADKLSGLHGAAAALRICKSAPSASGGSCETCWLAQDCFELGVILLRKKLYTQATKNLEKASRMWDGEPEELAQACACPLSLRDAPFIL